jgi:hypothetical protein
LFGLPRFALLETCCAPARKWLAQSAKGCDVSRMENLLSYYVLSGITTRKLEAELHRAIPTDVPCQARIELKLTPLAPTAAPAGNLVFAESLRVSETQGQSLQAHLFVTGLPTGSSRNEDRFFTLSVLIHAHYRPQGTEPGFEVFNRAHTSLTRQVLPLLAQRAMHLMHDIGIHHVQLPLDLVHAEAELKPSSYH